MIKILEKAEPLVQFWFILIVCGLALSPVMMSIGTIGLTIQWLLDVGFNRIKPWIFITFSATRNWILLYLLFLIGLLWSENWGFGWHDLKVKLPLLLLPMTMPAYLIELKKNNRQRIEWAFIASVFISALVSFLLVHNWMPFAELLTSKKLHLAKIREYSVFTSHVRMGLFVSLALALIWAKSKTTTALKLTSWVLSIFLLYYLILIESATGLALSVLTGILFILRYFRLRFPLRMRWLVAIGMGIILAVSLVYVYQQYLSYITPQPQQEITVEKTPYGNIYEHNPKILQLENGYYVHRFICWQELQSEWEKRSNLDFNGKDFSGGEVRYTLIRYLSSKGYRKDGHSLSSLNDQEIKEIENGLPNCQYAQMNGLTRRLDRLYFEYHMLSLGFSPNGHSLFQRLIYWKNATSIIKENWLTGVGTGDIEDAINKEYAANNHGLLKEFQLRTHNQYLTIWMSVGLIGILFCLVISIQMVKSAKRYSLVALIYTMIVLISFFTEDTLETQAGVTFVGFFTAWWLGAPLWTSEKWRPTSV
jgi:hypothetical protein